MCIESESTWSRILDQINREQDTLQAEHLHFDTWMHHRTNVAHAKYIERTSYRLRCDWIITPAKAAAAYAEVAKL